MLTFNEYLTKQKRDRESFHKQTLGDGLWGMFILLLKIRFQKIIASFLIPAILMQFVLFPRPALALPQGYTVESGEVSFDNTQDPNILTITAGDHAIINFDSFSIAQNETVKFLQPDTSASVLSRVSGGALLTSSAHYSVMGSWF